MTTKELITNYKRTTEKNNKFIAYRQNRRVNRKIKAQEQAKKRQDIGAGILSVVLLSAMVLGVFLYGWFIW